MIDVEEIINFLVEQPEGTKVYLGCDSECVKSKGKPYVDYILAVVVHIAGKHGAKVFGEVIREPMYDQKRNKPSMRLMTEVYKVSELYLKLAPFLDDVEIHLDINPNKEYGSSCVINEAIGYVRGVCNLEPLVKPQAWAASYAADRYKSFGM